MFGRKIIEPCQNSNPEFPVSEDIPVLGKRDYDKKDKKK